MDGIDFKEFWRFYCVVRQHDIAQVNMRVGSRSPFSPSPSSPSPLASSSSSPLASSTHTTSPPTRSPLQEIPLDENSKSTIEGKRPLWLRLGFKCYQDYQEARVRTFNDSANIFV